MFAMPKLLRRHAASCHVVDIIVALFFAFTALHVHVVVPIAIVEVAHSPTPSRVKIIASSKGDGKNALAA